jgi:hypothetical protein
MSDSIKVLEKPLPLDEAVKLADANNGRLDVVIAVDLGDLIDHDIEGLNDLADERIIDGNGTLSDINYRVVGHVEERAGGHFLTGGVLIRVTAEVNEF